MRPAGWIEAFPRGKRAFCGALFPARPIRRVLVPRLRRTGVFFSHSDAFGMGEQKKMNFMKAGKTNDHVPALRMVTIEDVCVRKVVKKPKAA